MRGDLHYRLPAVRAPTKHNVAFATWPRPIDGADAMTTRAQGKRRRSYCDFRRQRRRLGG